MERSRRNHLVNTEEVGIYREGEVNVEAADVKCSSLLLSRLRATGLTPHLLV
jgi:hypothetical protein